MARLRSALMRNALPYDDNFEIVTREGRAISSIASSMKSISEEKTPIPTEMELHFSLSPETIPHPCINYIKQIVKLRIA